MRKCGACGWKSKTNPCGLWMAAKGDTPKKPAKRGKLSYFQWPTTSVNDNYRLCCPLKIKYRDFQKTLYISTQKLFKVSKREGCQNVTLAEFCLNIGLNIEKSDTLSDRVCHACGRKLRMHFSCMISSRIWRGITWQ